MDVGNGNGTDDYLFCLVGQAGIQIHYWDPLLPQIEGEQVCEGAACSVASGYIPY